MAEEKVMAENSAADAKKDAPAKEKKKGFFWRLFNDEAFLEVIVVIFLGVTAIFTAWASWIGSLHGGNQATNYTESNNLSSEGNASWNEASQTMMQDMILWNDIADLQLEIMYAESNEDYDTVALDTYKLYYKCYDNLSDNMAAALGFDFDAASESDPMDYVLAWMDTAEAVNSPFSSQDYVDSYYTEAQETLDEADELLEQGKSDNNNGDKFNLVTVIYSLTLFLLGIVGIFKKIPNRGLVVIISVIIFIIATVYMCTIPLPTGFSLVGYFSA